MRDRQIVKVMKLMADNGWRTLREIRVRLGSPAVPEASISARLRDLRKIGLAVQRRSARIPGARVYEYRVLRNGVAA